MKDGVYKSGDLPDHLLQEFEAARDELEPVLLQFYIKYGPQAANAALGKIHIEILYTIINKGKLAQALAMQANYYLTAAEIAKEKAL